MDKSYDLIKKIDKTLKDRTTEVERKTKIVLLESLLNFILEVMAKNDNPKTNPHYHGDMGKIYSQDLLISHIFDYWKNWLENNIGPNRFSKINIIAHALPTESFKKELEDSVKDID